MKREVLLVIETSYYYYIDDPDNTMTDEQARDEGIKKLDRGEPDENPGCGWLNVVRHEVKVIG